MVSIINSKLMPTEALQAHDELVFCYLQYTLHSGVFPHSLSRFRQNFSNNGTLPISTTDQDIQIYWIIHTLQPDLLLLKCNHKPGQTTSPLSELKHSSKNISTLATEMGQ